MSYKGEWGNRDEKSAEHGLVRGAGESIWEGVSAYFKDFWEQRRLSLV